MSNSINRMRPCWTAKAAVLVAVLCLAIAIAQPAKAGTITGEVAFVGAFQATGGSSGTDLLNATGIDFTAFGLVVASTGDFASNGVGLLSPVALTDFTFDPFSGPINALWSVGSFSFSLESLTDITQTANSLALAGTGTVTSTIGSLSATAFTWSFSGDNSGGTLQLFSSSASPSTTVPEASTLTSMVTLLVMGMGIGVFCFRPRGRSQIALKV